MPKVKMTDEQRSLVENNIKLVYKYLSDHKLNRDELVDIYFEALCKAAIGYKKEIGVNFSVYAWKVFESAMKYTKKEIFNYKQWKFENQTGTVFLSLNQNKFSANYSDDELNLEETVSSKEQFEEGVETAVIFNDWINTLNEKEKEIVDLLIDGLSLVEIAEKFGCTKQNISRMKERIKRKYILFQEGKYNSNIGWQAK